MNIRRKVPNKIKAQENQELVANVSSQNANNIELLTNDLIQFKFDSDIIMAKINSDVDTRIGLKYHAKNTTDFDSFIESVREFVAVSGNVLTAKDINRLKTEYNKA